MVAALVTHTTTQLLDDLHDEAHPVAWQTFDARYRPIIVGFARSLGLGDADANDVAQETIARFVTEYRTGRYERGRGRLRSWLLGIARYRVLDLRRAAARRPARPAGTEVVNLEDDAALTRVWDREQRTAMLQLALRRLRDTTRTSPRTIEAFELLVLRGMSASEVAETLEIDRHDVYVAKNRVAEKLRAILGELESVYQEP